MGEGFVWIPEPPEPPESASKDEKMRWWRIKKVWFGTGLCVALIVGGAKGYSVLVEPQRLNAEAIKVIGLKVDDAKGEMDKMKDRQRVNKAELKAQQTSDHREEMDAIMRIGNKMDRQQELAEETRERLSRLEGRLQR